MRTRWIALFTCTASLAGTACAATTGVSRFHEGNSLMDPLTARSMGLHVMATNAGFYSDFVKQVSIADSTLYIPEPAARAAILLGTAVVRMRATR